MIHTFNSQQAPELEKFSETLSSNISAEMPFGEMKTESITAVQKEGEETWMKEKISVTLLKLNLPHTREYRRITNDKKTAFLSSQTSDKDQAKVKPGFNLIIQSFSFSE